MLAIDLITQNETGLNVEHEQLVQSDPLLVCLALMTELLDHPISMSVLKSGFALDS